VSSGAVVDGTLLDVVEPGEDVVVVSSGSVVDVVVVSSGSVVDVVVVSSGSVVDVVVTAVVGVAGGAVVVVADRRPPEPDRTDVPGDVVTLPVASGPGSDCQASTSRVSPGEPEGSSSRVMAPMASPPTRNTAQNTITPATSRGRLGGDGGAATRGR
jgi:hypothetical protein